LERAIAPLGVERDASAKIIEGARWRSTLNSRFLKRAAGLVGGPAGVFDGDSSTQTLAG
jgi:hypothetical protein